MPNINFLYNNFLMTLNKYENLINDISAYSEFRNGKYRPIFKKNKYYLIELIFLKVYVSWETYLEESFIRYMCGYYSVSGYTPTRYIYPENLTHAFNLLKENRDYIDWTTSGQITRRAKLFFKDGEPYYTPISSIITVMDEMKVIRNKIAHDSDMANKKFYELVRSKIGYVPKGTNPGKLLLSVLVMNQPNSLINTYINTLKSINRIIIP